MTLPSNRGEDTYFLGREGRQYGPYPWEEICRMGSEGNLFSDDLLWSPALGAWTPAGSVESLQCLARSPVVPSRRRWWIPVAVAAGLALTTGVGFLLYSLLSHASPNIMDYHPKEGPSGSYVILELSAKPKLERLRVRYGGADLPFTGLGERYIGVNIPVEGGSDTLRLYDGEREAGAAAFTVRAPVVTPLYEAKLYPTAQKQEARTREGITVTLPGGFLKRVRTLSIARVENAAVYRDDPFGSQEVFDISIEGLKQLDGFVEIGVPYDPAKLDKDIPVEANFAPARWDDERKSWVDLYYRVDESTHTLHAITDHFSLMVFGVSVVGLAQTAVTTVVVGGTVGELVERWANDKYLSRDHKVRVLYSDKALRATFPDDQWKNAISKANLYLVDIYDPKVSCAVQDIAHIFEESLKRYTEAGFPDLAEKSFLGIPYRRYVKVKIDSLYNYYAQKGEMAQETFWDTIHIPTEIIKLEFYNRVNGNDGPFEQNFNFFKSGLAHELFHSMQGQYYGTLSTAFLKTQHKWWREATAEWAGNDLAKIPYRAGWDQDAPVLLSRLGPRFLGYPINSKGKIAGTASAVGGLEYEYLSAVYIRYLVREMNYGLKDLVAYVAEAGRKTDPLVQLRAYVKEKSAKTLDAVHADFAAWLLGETQLAVSDFGNPSNLKVAADKSEVLNISREKAALRISQKSRPANDRILVFRTKGGNEKLDPKAKPFLVISENQPKAHEIEAVDGDILYFIAANASPDDRIVNLIVEEKTTDPSTATVKWESRTTFAMDLKKYGTAGVWAVKISTGMLKIEPEKLENAAGYREYEFTVKAEGLAKEVRKARFEYDFGDKGKNAKGDVTAGVSGGSVQVKLKYAYEPSPGLKPEDRPLKYLLKVNMLHEGRNLGSAAAEVTVDKAEVIIQPPRVIVLDLSGGATESAETFAAYAKPEGGYRFDWEFGDGKAFTEVKPPGATSTVGHTYAGLMNVAQFTPKVRLFSQAGVLLAEDVIVIKTGGSAKVEYDCGWPVDYARLTAIEGPDQLYYINEAKAFHGPSLRWYDSSRKQLMVGGCHKDGKAHGRWTYWYENGVKQREINYVGGIQHGQEITWHPNGAEQWEVNYFEGEKHGLYTVWYNNGVMSSQGRFERGKSVGIWTSWNDNGKCYSKVNYGTGGGSSTRLPCD